MRRKLYEALISRLRADTLEAYALIEEILENPGSVENPLDALVEQAQRLAQSEGAVLTINGYFDKVADSQAEKAFLHRQASEQHHQLHQLMSAIESHVRPAELPADSVLRVVDEDMSPTFKRSQKSLKKEESDEEE